ncbi:cytosolic endo-beta-N-acetylglucosaminidase isoform X2 [Rhynchophorus ferrugineus]|uniref:cytosolic endo-beta-N-acetylglucosaminidase isoform X2 n=1 Tax=Rhynchophorus ferrugineus TaxID=354439 RepID=UPI003FCD9E46
MSGYVTCNPIKNISELESCLSNPPQWVDKVMPLRKRSGLVIKNRPVDCHVTEDQYCDRTRLSSYSTPKTLVCHDYKGGYLTDSYVPLSEVNETIAKEGYSLYNWSQIDYFVYFSHHLITIPPLSWINVAHQNGVKVLVITEFSKGEEICEKELFGNHDNMTEFAYNLSEILNIFGFDGWLLNIENEVKNTNILKKFVKILTENVHKANYENVVLWYDSVIESGYLKWQDELNLNNKCFFDMCDGIFLNYCWKEESLIKSVELAGHRSYDVFVGIDIFGRNMFGGGKFNTFKAVEVVSKYNLSMALFAPGWTYETMDKYPSETAFSRFLTRDDTLWSSLKPFLFTHPINYMFSTSFHIGLNLDTYNLFLQEQQLSRILFPDSLHTVLGSEAIESLKNCCDCIKRGYQQSKNVCLLSNEKIKTSSKNVVHNLFSCDLKLKGKIVLFVKTEKVGQLDTTIELQLLTSLGSGSMRKIKLLDKRKSIVENNISLLEVNPLDETEIKKYFSLDQLREKHNNSKSLSIYLFTTHKCTLLEVGAVLLNGHSIYLTDFGLDNLK